MTPSDEEFSYWGGFSDTPNKDSQRQAVSLEVAEGLV